MSIPTPQEISKELNDFLLKYSSTKHLAKGLDTAIDGLVQRDAKAQAELEALEQEISYVKSFEANNKRVYEQALLDVEKETEVKRALMNEIVKIRKKIIFEAKELKLLDAEHAKCSMQVDLNLESLTNSENELKSARFFLAQAEQQRSVYDNLSKNEAAKVAVAVENVHSIKITSQTFQQSLAAALSTSLDIKSKSPRKAGSRSPVSAPSSLVKSKMSNSFSTSSLPKEPSNNNKKPVNKIKGSSLKNSASEQKLPSISRNQPSSKSEYSKSDIKSSGARSPNSTVTISNNKLIPVSKAKV